MLFGVSDIAIKAIIGLVGESGLVGLVSPWLALAALIAFYASARSLQDGEAVPVIATTETAATVSNITGGTSCSAIRCPATPWAWLRRCWPSP